MSSEKWHITFKILRQNEQQKPFFQLFELEVDPDEYVLDGIERVWAFHDRSLSYRHACHHSTCGVCGMRINGVEKLTCITPIRDVAHDHGIIQVEPLRNFPVISDLVVDVSSMFQKMERFHTPQVTANFFALAPGENALPATDEDYERLIDCIECGLCISACPSSLTSSEYLGPAGIASAHQAFKISEDRRFLSLVDCQDGVWRCHSAFECTEVCPSNVNPAARIMALRRTIIKQKITSLFSGGKHE